MSNNIFLNIIVLFSPNYEKTNQLGCVIKNISLINQFIAFYRSIKKNIKNIKYDISIVHHKDFNMKDLSKLNSIDVNLIKFDCDKIEDVALSRYNVDTRIKGTHRLIAETDMLFLKEPNFNWNVDFQKMYAGSSKTFPINIMNKIYKIYNIKNKYIKNYNINHDLFVSYNVKKINKKYLFPHFNNGLTLIKEDFAKKFFEKIISLDLFNRFYINFDKKYYYHAFQIIYGLVLLELTDNWEPFEPGINYLLKVYNCNKFGKDNISLLHYCGCGAGKIALKEFPDYFKN
uniref:Uncharacterized protein n=1 Tax=viral metagenome TaxID=1070528 RepID=A0A6C0LZ91_9ZZZZ